MSFCVWWCCSCDLVRALLLQYISNPVTECEGSMCCFYTKLLFHFCILALIYLNLCAARVGEMQTPCYQCCCQSNVSCSGFPLGNKVIASSYCGSIFPNLCQIWWDFSLMCQTASKDPCLIPV